MKKNETKYITMTGEELGVRLRELQGKLLTLRTQTVTEKVEDPTAIGKTRREIARVLTARRAIHLGITQNGAAPAAKSAKPARSKPKAAKPVAKAPKAGGGGSEKAKAPKAKRGSKKISKKTASKSK